MMPDQTKRDGPSVDREPSQDATQAWTQPDRNQPVGILERASMELSVEQTIAVTFQNLEGVLANALSIVPVTVPSQLLALVPTGSTEAHRLVLAELIKLDMAKAAERSLERSLGFYDEIRNQFDSGQLPLDLVLEEIRLRRARGQSVDASQYKARFPHWARVLDDVLTSHPTRGDLPSLERAPSFADGDQVDDFKILQRLGRGGFANVYLARQHSMQRLVALKVSHSGSDEPIALSQLDHPNIVRVFDQRQLQTPPMILLYMQYVAGGTLADIIRQTSSLPASALGGRAFLNCIDQALLAAGQQPPEGSPIREAIESMDWPKLVAWIGTQLADGLAAAHRVGIMHRDVKPANCLLSAEGIPKLADFNVSFTTAPGCAGAAVHFGGSLGYMSPEQLQIVDPASARSAEDLDARSDLYSLAMVLWELWQGQRPAVADAMVSGWHAAVHQQLDLRGRIPQVVRNFDSASQRVLEQALRAGLSFDRELRPGSAEEMAGRLRLALHESAASLFEPPEGSWLARFRRVSLLFTTAIVIFLPNGLAGILNYQYNLHTVQSRYPQLEPAFIELSMVVNCIAFPVGGGLLIWLSGRVRRAVRTAQQNRRVSSAAIDEALQLGHQAAMVGGGLWVAAGLVFPLVLRWMEPELKLADAAEFFLSLAVCGGIAWIYPFFGVSLIGLEVVYPLLVAAKMSDDALPQRAARLSRRALVYLGSAGAIPLLGLALLVVRQSIVQSDWPTSVFLLIVVALTGLALAVAFWTYQRLLKDLRTLREVLGGPS